VIFGLLTGIENQWPAEQEYLSGISFMVAQ